ncbi:MAG: serine/threonine protein kinase [Planctomycetota bacterium]|nr:serine/threonine protein kinase [Planctomycetota bacterium]
MATLVGKTLGNFEILEEVGRGAMGVVFKARQLSMDRIVALKFLPRSMASDEKRVQRFIREAHAAGKLSHPNIVHVHDVGQLEGYYYISMEFVDGTTAHKQLKEQGPFDEAACLEIGTQIASALKEAHERGILHRDIKPDNFLLDKDGSARLADLGLARFEDKKEGQDGHLTQDGTALGTPHYMAPEQARGEKLDGRTDLYGLGSSLYTMAAGHTPFEGKTPALIMVKVINEEPASLKSIRPELSPGFVAVVEKLMQKDPEKRFQNAQEVVDAFGKVKAGEYVGRSGAATGKAGRITTGKVGRVTTGPAARVRPRGESGEGKNHSGLFVGLGIAAAALLGGLFLFSGGSGGNSAPRREAKSAEHETPKPVAPAILPSVPAKNDAAKKAFEQLAARHEQALGPTPPAWPPPGKPSSRTTGRPRRPAPPRRSSRKRKRPRGSSMRHGRPSRPPRARPPRPDATRRRARRSRRSSKPARRIRRSRPRARNLPRPTSAGWRRSRRSSSRPTGWCNRASSNPRASSSRTSGADCPRRWPNASGSPKN